MRPLLALADVGEQRELARAANRQAELLLVAT